MKKGILTRKKIKINLDGNDFVNLGDWIQVIAAEIIFKQLEIRDYLYIDRDYACEYDGEEVKLLYYMYNSITPKYHDYNYAFPLSNKISPVFFSFQLEDEFIPSDILNQLQQAGKSVGVGCRDEETMNNLREKGINAYLTGCITSLLPLRDKTIIGDKVVFIDAPESVLPFVPEVLKKDAVFLSHIYRINRRSGDVFLTDYEIDHIMGEARRLLDYYKNHAKLIITSRLHAASPCLALGIPVILVRDEFDFDGRFSWIDKYLPLYTKDMYNNIDWNPNPVFYEKRKKCIFNVLKKVFVEEVFPKEDIEEIERFYSFRQRTEYYKKPRNALINLELKDGFEYAIWGGVVEAQSLKKLIRKIYPNSKLVKVYDKKMKGKFEGIEMQSPDIIERSELVYFVVSISAHESAKQKLNMLRNTYVLVDFRKESWEIHLFD